MAKKVPIHKIGIELDSLINEFGIKQKGKAKKAIRKSLVDVWGSVIEDTPVDEGGARGAWIVDNEVPKPIKTRKSKIKGKNYVNRKLSGVNFMAGPVFLYNYAPYIFKLEYGGYPSPVKKGTWNKRKKRYEIRSKNGFSKQAPKGMLRINLLRWSKTLRKNYKAA